MLHALNILAASGDDTGSQLIWVIAVLVMSAIGAIAGKIKERSQKQPPKRPEPSTKQPEPDDERSVTLPRPGPPRPGESASRPMPRVPRPPARSGDRPIGIPKRTGPVPLPERSRPVPSRPPVSRYPVERPPVQPQAPRPVRRLEPVASVTAGSGDRPKTVIAGTGLREETVVAAPQRRPGGLGRFRLTPDRLREAIVLKEVLGPPVSMRESEHLF